MGKVVYLCARNLSDNKTEIGMTTMMPINVADTLLHPQFIKDTAGENLVVFSQQEFEMIVDKIEDLYDNQLYDQALQEDTGERILLSDYLKSRAQRNG
ncbi:hypothetical protein FACS1894199_10510 [Bacteroidia bacterium]|nr:hypothetical protein FACS1894199_10510 [Bacteroidia bacterium]